MNCLLCSVGRRGELIKDFHKTLGADGKIVATDCSPYAPALYMADKSYIVPPISDKKYIDTLLEICKKEQIQAVMTFIDPEIEVLAGNRGRFEKIGTEVLVPFYESARLCFDKYLLYRHLRENGIPTIQTYAGMEEFLEDLQNGKIGFPVFVKPRTGSGSVGARAIADMEELRMAIQEDPTLIIQELMDGTDLDADVYVDIKNRKVASVFAKKKLSTTVGGANKTISFTDERLFRQICRITETLELYGPNDMDFFFKNGEYFLSEINPRFGGAYLHAYAAGVDFIKLIENNVNGFENSPCFGNYENGIVMMMYDSIVVKAEKELVKEAGLKAVMDI